MPYLHSIDSYIEICCSALNKAKKTQFIDLICALNKQIYRVA